MAGIEGKVPGWEGESLNYKDKGTEFSDFLIPRSLKSDVVDLYFFKLYML